MDKKFSLGLVSGSWRLFSIKFSKKIQMQRNCFPILPCLRIAVEAERV